LKELRFGGALFVCGSRAQSAAPGMLMGNKKPATQGRSRFGKFQDLSDQLLLKAVCSRLN
jgi:hypothetical protein